MSHTWISHVSSETAHLYHPSFSQLPCIFLREPPASVWVPMRYVTHGSVTWAARLSISIALLFRSFHTVLTCSTCERECQRDMSHTWISHVSSETAHVYRPAFSQFPCIFLRAPPASVWVPMRHATHMNQSCEQRDSACLSRCFFAASMDFRHVSVCQWGVCHTWIRHESSETPASLPPCFPFIYMYTYI